MLSHKEPDSASSEVHFFLGIIFTMSEQVVCLLINVLVHVSLDGKDSVINW